MAEQANLTNSDVQRLLQDPSPDNRAAAAGKVAASFGSAVLTDAERTLALEIFRLMVRDAEVRVRKALSENLMKNPDVPRDVALALARDVDEVSEPMLEFGAVLTDADLIEIVRSGAPRKQVAVAKREGVSAELAHVIASEAGAPAVAALMSNETARIEPGSFSVALDRFGADETVQGAMVKRSQLPVSVAERLVTLVSSNLKQHLVTHHELPIDLATDLILQARERATLNLAQDAEREDVPTLVDKLYRNHRLTPTLVLRALCAGDMDFFESAMAKMAGIPVVNAYRLIHDEGGLGLARLIERCGLSPEFLGVAKVAVEVARELQHDGRPGDRDRFTVRMLERVLTCFENDPESDNLDYLIGKLAKTAPPPKVVSI